MAACKRLGGIFEHPLASLLSFSSPPQFNFKELVLLLVINMIIIIVIISIIGIISSIIITSIFL